MKMPSTEVVYRDATLDALTAAYDAPLRTSVLTQLDTEGVRNPLKFIAVFLDSPLQNLELEVMLLSLARASAQEGSWVGLCTQYTAEDVAAIEAGEDSRMNSVGCALHRAIQRGYCEIFEEEGTFYFVPERSLIAFMQSRLCPSST
jgi:hypothetical protein